MARYYFDVDDGSRLTKDGRGTNLGGIEAARQEALSALCEMARDILPGAPDRQNLLVKVRDKAGQRLLTAKLSLSVERGGQPPAD